MKFIGVDLAARFSAGVQLGSGGEVEGQFDSWGISYVEFAQRLATFAQDADALILVEDLPYGISGQGMVKKPLRAQGAVIAHLDLVGALPRTWFLAPATWKRHFEMKLRGQSEKEKAETARLKALDYGYSAPEMLSVHAGDIPPLGAEHSKLRSSIRSQLKKAQTDYYDGFLIARYLYELHTSGTDLSRIQGIQTVEL